MFLACTQMNTEESIWSHQKLICNSHTTSTFMYLIELKKKSIDNITTLKAFMLKWKLSPFTLIYIFMYWITSTNNTLFKNYLQYLPCFFPSPSAHVLSYLEDFPIFVIKIFLMKENKNRTWKAGLMPNLSITNSFKGRRNKEQIIHLDLAPVLPVWNQCNQNSFYGLV